MAKNLKDNSFSASELNAGDWGDVEFKEMGDFSEIGRRIISPKDKSKGGYKRCFETHPSLAIKVDGKTYYVQGGTCIQTPPKDTDVFVGFDRGMKGTGRIFPWSKGHEFLYPIKDMGVPQHLVNFKAMIAWLESMVLEGHKVYMGCIGGHGRTGLVMAALITHMTGELGSIEYVRKHYCKKAVESQQQIDWLHEHFGIKKAKPTKGVWGASVSVHPLYGETSSSLCTKGVEDTIMVSCIPVSGCIHGDNL